MIFCVFSHGYVAVGFVTHIATVAFAIFCINTGVALARPTFMAALSVRVPRERQGTIMRAIQSLVAVTDVVSPVVAGLILGLVLYQAWIGAVVEIALTGLSALLAHTRMRREDGREAIEVRSCTSDID
ncbi:hypothetical protein ACSV5G_21435 [Agrobacterium cavarae]|uniref:hypothetical protein n=1 Tax=Agrobacterium cavarae TaxID=2528239 RepID=UPI003FD167E9